MQSWKDVRKEQLFKANFVLEDDGNGLVFSNIDNKKSSREIIGKDCQEYELLPDICEIRE